MPKLNKSEFIEQLSVQLGVTVSKGEEVVNKFIRLIYSTLADGGSVNLSGFGAFSVSHRDSRIGVNPRQPSEKITIPELNTPKFKAGEAFKDVVKLKK